MRSSADLFLASRRVQTAPYNLLSTSNGKFLLESDQDWEQLRTRLACDYSSGLLNFLVESKTTVFPLFLDIDFAHPTLDLRFVEGPLLSGIFRGVADALSPVFPVTSQQVLITAAAPKPVKDGRTKTGVHLHWQWLRINGGRKVHAACTTETAMCIRACILRQLAGVAVQDPPLEYEDVVDPRVLAQNGCRMLFSGKSTPCPDCLRLRRALDKDLPCQQPGLRQPRWRCPCPACPQADARAQVGVHRA